MLLESAIDSLTPFYASYPAFTEDRAFFYANFWSVRVDRLNPLALVDLGV